jgi:hypothetical protein
MPDVQRLTDEQERQVVDLMLTPEGPHAWARLWVECMLDNRDLPNAWLITTEGFRRLLTRAYVVDALKLHELFPAYIVDQVIEGLVAGRLSPYWEGLCEMVPIAVASSLDGLHSDLSVSTKPRPVAPGLELVVFVDTGGESISLPDGEIDKGRHHRLLMQRHADDVWLVANINQDAPAM